MPEERLNIRLDVDTRYDLEELARHLNLNHSAVVRLALRRLAQQEGIARRDGA